MTFANLSQATAESRRVFHRSQNSFNRIQNSFMTIEIHDQGQFPVTVFGKFSKPKYYILQLND